jgi:uncharacterized OB-fold protein
MTVLEPVEAAGLYLTGEPGEVTALCASSCASCGRVSFPRRSQCPACGAACAPIELRGPAHLRVQTSVLAQPPGARVTAPYDVGVAEFDEGICVIGLVDGPAERGDRVVPIVHEPYPDGRIFAFRRAT